MEVVGGPGHHRRHDPAGREAFEGETLGVVVEQGLGDLEVEVGEDLADGRLFMLDGVGGHGVAPHGRRGTDSPTCVQRCERLEVLATPEAVTDGERHAAQRGVLCQRSRRPLRLGGAPPREEVVS
jgi:hypothetical protein